MANLSVTDDLIKLSDDEPDDSVFTDGLGQDLLNALECPVCMEYMTPPIFLCENGHSICSHCRPQLPLCPTCRRHFLSNARNVGLESIAVELDYPCRNSGCDEVLPLEEITQHQAVCPHRPFECPLVHGSHCAWKGPHSLIKKHVMESHVRYVREGSQSVSILNDVSSTPGYSMVIFAFGQVFLQKCRMQDCQFYSAVQYIGPKENASKYRFEFELSTSNGHHKVLVGDLVTSDSEDMQSVRRAGRCVMLDHNVIKCFMYEDKLPYKLRLYEVDRDVS
jgi:hypothetical protein